MNPNYELLDKVAAAGFMDASARLVLVLVIGALLVSIAHYFSRRWWP